MVADVAQNQRGARQPGDPAQRAEVGLDDEVAVALLPRGRLEARHGLHLHVDGQEVIAGVPFLVDRIEEEATGRPLADEATLHVGECGHDRVDLATRDQRFELCLVQPARHALGLVGFLMESAP